MRVLSTVVKVDPIVPSRGFVKVKRESTFHAWMQEGAQMLAPPSFMLMEWPWFFGYLVRYMDDVVAVLCFPICSHTWLLRRADDDIPVP
ncbi:hypothetical protein SI65_09316 [Aspergillus cristatus]|uniref:Uncharacterized protein n=1 Tax=Aspergillus cristatus TaxID=573508 RepID=A0A1E3B335_ASPCR|nr:hypothetical protein SI65_09316 [Aspergillus cristatus]